MRDNPIHTFIQFMTGQIPDLITLGDLRWLMVALYWLLFLGGIGVAVTTWRCDPAQRTANHLAAFVLRFTAAGMWFLGTLWKLPLPVSAGFKFWMAQTVKYRSFQIHADFMRVLLDHVAIAQPLVFLLEIGITASLMLGFAVRLFGTLGALFTLNLLIGLYNDPTEWPWTYVGIITSLGMFAATHAGRSLGLDGLLLNRPITRLSSHRWVAKAYLLAS